MTDTTPKDKDESPSPGESNNNGENDSVGGGETMTDQEQQQQQQQPSGNPFPPPGFQGFYGYPSHDGTGSTGDGSAPTATFFPFQTALYPYANPNGGPYIGMNIGQLTAVGAFIPQHPHHHPHHPQQHQHPNGKAKRSQVKNACVNCANACKRCDNNRPCERCKKYGLQDGCVDSARKERKKGIKRGPYKRRLKAGQQVSDVGNNNAEHDHPDAEWLPNGASSNNSQPTTVDPANLPNNAGGGQTGAGGAAAFAPPEGYYTYPYPYPYPGATTTGHDGQPGHDGTTYPHPPHFYPHLHPAYPPYPPWGQPPASFDVTTAGGGGDEHQTATGGGSARTTAKKKRSTAAHMKKGSDDMKSAVAQKRDATAAARATRAARRRSSGGGNGNTDTNTQNQNSTGDGVPDLSEIDMTGVTDPSLLAEHHQVNGDVGIGLEDSSA